jgi:hypothetical protein
MGWEQYEQEGGQSFYSSSDHPTTREFPFVGPGIRP